MGSLKPNDHTLTPLNTFGTECSSKSHSQVLSDEDMVQVQGCARHNKKSILSESLPSFYRKGFARAVFQKSILFPPGLYACHSDGSYRASQNPFQQVLAGTLVFVCSHQMTCVYRQSIMVPYLFMPVAL